MAELSDRQLLAEYVSHNSQEAFATLVRRHINLVYAAAFRQVDDFHKAEEVTQAVFLILAKKAACLRKETVLPGWLYQTARLTSAGFLRAERRRQHREHEAFMQSTLNDFPTEPAWEKLAPLLDEAMGRLGETDRNAIVLRFFEVRPISEVATALGLEEWAARKRLERAVEKLRRFFVKRGVAFSAVAICGALSANAAQAAPPATLAATVAAAATAKGVAATASTLTLIKGALKLMAWTKAKTAIVSGVVVLLAAGTTTITIYEIHARQTEKLWRLNKDLPSDQIDRLPPMVKILPTKFSSVWVTWNSGANGDKFAGSNARAGDIAVYAYGFPRGRIHFAEGEPTNRFDFVATLPQGSREALQRELKMKLGLIGRRETENMNVLLFQVDHANAPGLKPPNLEENHTYWNTGVFHSSGVAMDTGAPRFEGLAEYLERYFKMPVIDQTGITQQFSIDLRWKEMKGHPNHEGLEQALLEQLGLELVPTNMPVEMLVIEKAGN